MKSAFFFRFQALPRRVLAASIASLAMVEMVHGDVNLLGPVPLSTDDVGGEDLNLMGDAQVTLSGAGSILIENILWNLSGNPVTTLTVNNAADATKRTLAAGGVVLGTADGMSLVVSGSADLRFSGLTNGGFGNLQLVKDGGTGELILDGVDNQLGDKVTLRVVNGTMSIEGAGGTASPISSLLNAIRIDGADAKLRLGTLTAPGTVFANAILVNESGTLEHTAASDDTLTGNVTLATGKTLTANITDGSLLLSGQFTGGGSANLTKTGTGTLILAGASTGVGLTTINAGTLQFGNPGALYGGTTTSWTPANISVASGATLAVNVGGAGDFSVSQVGTLLSQLSSVSNNGLKAGASVAFDTTNAVGPVSYSSVIANSTGAGGGAIGLVKRGAGTLSLEGANTYTGATTIRGGTLALAGTASINSSSAISIAGGATFDVAAVSGYALAQTLSAKGAGTASISGGVNAGAQMIDLQDGTSIGLLALSDTLTLSGATIRFDLAAAGGDQITVGGAVSLSGTNTINVAAIASAASLTMGAQAYTLIIAGSGLVSSSFSLSSSTLTIGATTYTLSLSGDATHQYLGVTSGSLAVPTTYTLTTSASAHNIHAVTGSSTITTTITNTGTTGGNNDPLTYASLGSTVTPAADTTLSSPAAGGSVAPNAGGSANATANQSFSSTVAGSYTLTASGGAVTNTTLGGPATLQGSAGTDTVNVFRLAAPGALVTPVTFVGNHHVGDVVGMLSLSVTNTAAADGFSEKLDAIVTGSTGGVAGTGSVSLLAPGASDAASLQVGMDTSTVGAKGGTVTIGLTSNGEGTSGLGTTGLTSQVVTVNAGSVFRLAAAATIGAQVTLPNVHVGETFGASALSITNTSANDGFSEGLNATTGNLTGDASGAGVVGNLIGNSSAISVGLGNASTATAGAKTGTVDVLFSSSGTNSSLTDTALGAQTVTVSGGVYNLAAAGTIGAVVDLGRIHVNGTFGTSALSISNAAAAGAFTEGLNAGFGATTGAATHNSGTVSNLAGGEGNAASLVMGLGGAANTGTAGAVSGTVTVALVSNGTNSGLTDTSLTSQVVTVSGFVYSGLGVWDINGGGSWAAVANWQANGGVPGLDAGFTATDTATFGSAATSANPAVSLNGASPDLRALTFSNADRSYTLDGAGGGTLKLNNGAGIATVTDSSGSHVISAPVELDSDTTIAVAADGDHLVISGIISESTAHSLTKTGAGKLILSGANTFTGRTTISGGVLQANISGDGLPVASNLLLSGGVLQGDGPVSLIRSLGIGSNAIQWGGDGGFAASGGLMNVLLNYPDASPLIWASTPNFVAGQLLFGSSTADSLVDFQNDIDLNNASRTIRVDDNTGSAGDSAQLSGTITGGGAAGALVKVGAGSLTLSGAQTYAALVTNGGTTNLNGSFTGGTSTISANATTNINASQTLAALNIADGVVVTFGAGPEAALGAEWEKVAASPAPGSSVVPEPGAIGLLLVGAVGLLARRRRA